MLNCPAHHKALNHPCPYYTLIPTWTACHEAHLHNPAPNSGSLFTSLHMHQPLMKLKDSIGEHALKTMHSISPCISHYKVSLWNWGHMALHGSHSLYSTLSFVMCNMREITLPHNKLDEKKNKNKNTELYLCQQEASGFPQRFSYAKECRRKLNLQ